MRQFQHPAHTFYADVEKLPPAHCLTVDREGLRTWAYWQPGSAVGSNAIAWLIPCHRVIRQTGVMDGYRWGSDLKRAMLGWEAAQAA
jgi:hypothetical protein